MTMSRRVLSAPHDGYGGKNRAGQWLQSVPTGIVLFRFPRVFLFDDSLSSDFFRELVKKMRVIHFDGHVYHQTNAKETSGYCQQPEEVNACNTSLIRIAKSSSL